MRFAAFRTIAALLLSAALFFSCGSAAFAADGDDNYGEWNSEWEPNGETEIIITEQPQSISVKPGESAAFTVKALGSELRYQWYYKKTAAYGGTSFLLWKGHMTASTSAIANDTWDGMQVYCEVTDKNGNTQQSEKAVITTDIPLEITRQPQDVSLHTGETASFSVKVKGKNLRYQWYFRKSGAGNWTQWNGHTTPTTKATANATWDGMQVYCVIKDAGGDTVSSDPATITLTDDLTITSHPSNVTANVGDTVKFTAQAQGIGLKYQWYYRKSGAASWSVWKNHTTASTSAVANATWDGMRVYCKVEDKNGHSQNTESAIIQLSGMPRITEQPADLQTRPGETVTFSVKAQGSALKYQWYYKKYGAKCWSLWKNHTTASTSAIANDTWNGMQVYCVITDGFGRSVSSDPSTVKLLS